MIRLILESFNPAVLSTIADLYSAVRILIYYKYFTFFYFFFQCLTNPESFVTMILSGTRWYSE